MGQVVIDVAVAHQVVVFLEAEGETTFHIGSGWHTLPVEVVVVRLALMAVVVCLVG